MRHPHRPYRSADLPKVQELLDQGKTHAEIEEETGVATRTISRWLSKELLHRPSPVPVGVAPADAPEREPQEEWTARAVLELGMDPNIVARVLRLAEHPAATSDRRYRELLSRYVPLAAKIPDEWATAVAFLPIFARDLCNPELEQLAELMRESVPWKSEELRSRYGSQARPLLSDAIVELYDWLHFVSNTDMDAPRPVVEAGLISEVFQRCPQVDRPVRKRWPADKEGRKFGLHLLREMPMGALAIVWTRILDGEPPWVEAYANYREKLQEADGELKGARLAQVETLAFGRRRWLKRLGWWMSRRT